jgi:uncharacterized membrane protein
MRVVVRVVDRNTGVPLEGAMVMLGLQTAVTGRDGTAVFDVPPGSYNLRVGRSGYRYESAFVTLTTPSEVTVSLIPSMVML